MDIAKRFDTNPIVTPPMVKPSLAGLEVTCALNPGAFRYDGKTCLLMRIAERQKQREGYVGTVLIDPASPGGMRLVEFSTADPQYEPGGACSFGYGGVCYLTTLSHLRLARSDDGVNFTVDDAPTLTGEGPLEGHGIEDCRVTQIEDEYVLTYTAASDKGYGVAVASTRDWMTFQRAGVVMAPDNKDAAVFPEKIGGEYWCLHRPESKYTGPAIWIARSKDLVHWGGNAFLAASRKGTWDEKRLGAGAAPIRTERGWLEIYHGVCAEKGYSLGGLLLDLEDPTKVIARSDEPFMEPTMDYEKRGFVNSVVFTNGHVVDGDTVTVYYGASDSVICGAQLSIEEMLATLKSV
jgi:predicted GH43/DUF377 family glycosyl hydrolase